MATNDASGSTKQIHLPTEMEFTDPQVILFVTDCERAAAFYRRFGFRETFRTTPDPPAKVEMALERSHLGLALPEPAA